MESNNVISGEFKYTLIISVTSFLNDYFHPTVMFLGVILIMFCITETYQTTDLYSQPTKITKTKNVDVTLRCALLDKHEKFNQNVSVTWWFKKTCRISCWNRLEADEWTELDCNGCGLLLDLNDSTASNGFYMCKIFPYKISEFTTLQIEVTKTFQLEIIGKFSIPSRLGQDDLWK